MANVRALGVVLALIWGGCRSEDAPTAGERCRLTSSSNACLQCQATKCSSQFDYCFGAGFHRGDLVAADQANRAAPCYDFSACVQTCGCHTQCFETCDKQLSGACATCQKTYSMPCIDDICAAECSRSPDGGA
jgi:hypothetical protein